MIMFGKHETQEAQIQFDFKLQVSYKLWKSLLAILPNCNGAHDFTAPYNRW